MRLANAYGAAGELDATRAALQSALEILEQLDHPEADHIRTRLRGLASGESPRP